MLRRWHLQRGETGQQLMRRLRVDTSEQGIGGEKA